MLKIGQIVLYRTTSTDKEYFRNQNTLANVSEFLPAVIVAVWDEAHVNLKVFCDGIQDLWKTSISYGSGEGIWKYIE